MRRSHECERGTQECVRHKRTGHYGWIGEYAAMGSMYVPKVFAVDDVPKLQDFMDEFNFASVVTERDGELTASHLPFWLDRSEEPYGVLRAHVAIRNPQLKDL